MGRDSGAARAVAEAFERRDLPNQQARRQVLLYLDNTLFRHDRDPYRLLGLTPDCRLADIRLRHKQLLQVFHPDRHPDEQDWFTDRSERLNRAYAYLKANHGKPGSTSIPTETTVTGTSSPGPAARQSPKPQRNPRQTFTDKDDLRRRLQSWLGNPANLQQREYIVVIAVPILLLLLLYLSNSARFNQAAPSVVLSPTESDPPPQLADNNAAARSEPRIEDRAEQSNARGTATSSDAAGQGSEASAATTAIRPSDEPNQRTPAANESQQTGPGKPDSRPGSETASNTEVAEKPAEAEQDATQAVEAPSQATREADNDATIEPTTIAVVVQEPEPAGQEPETTPIPPKDPVQPGVDAGDGPVKDTRINDKAVTPEQTPQEPVAQQTDLEIQHPDRALARPNPITAAAAPEAAAPEAAEPEPTEPEPEPQSEPAPTPDTAPAATIAEQTPSQEPTATATPDPELRITSHESRPSRTSSMRINPPTTCQTSTPSPTSSVTAQKPGTPRARPRSGKSTASCSARPATEISHWTTSASTCLAIANTK
ncbi:MAG: DnaJ domain-containing protein [Gammaproteobacteria bacterium]|nr:DnaJ domain-containing protein [Gammaproteobacteria bacterium]